MDKLVTTTEKEAIDDEFEHVMKLFLKSGQGDTQLGDCIQNSYELLIYKACSLNLTDMLESLLAHLRRTVNDTSSCLMISFDDYRSIILYDCLATAVEKNHNTVIRTLLDFVAKEQMHESNNCYTTLHCAAANGDILVATLLIKAGVDVNQTNIKDETALHFASDAATAEILLRNGANVNATNKRRESPLYYACATYRLGVIKKLMEYGAEPNLPSVELNNACTSGVDSAIANALLQLEPPNNCFNIPTSCVWNAIKNNDDLLLSSRSKETDGFPLCCTAKLENQALVDHISTRNKELHKSRACDDYPTLTMAVFEIAQNRKESGVVGIEEFEDILSKSDNASINAINKHGTTALYLAIERNLIKVATMLLDAGADPNLAAFGKYPIIVACRYLSPDYVKLLLDRGADPNVVDCYGKSPLFIAAESLDLPLVKLLVEHGADVNQIDRTGKTALHSIVEFILTRVCKSTGVGCVDTVRYFLDKGFKINQPNAKGETVLYHATDCLRNNQVRGRFDRVSIPYQIFELLLERGADVNMANCDGDTAMTLAARNQCYIAIRELLRHGGDIKHVSKSNTSLLSEACGKPDPRSASLLLAAGADTTNFSWHSLEWSTLKDNSELIDMLLNNGVPCNPSKHNGTETTERLQLKHFYIPFCRSTEGIVRFFKASSSLDVLATACKGKCKGMQANPFSCRFGGRLCQAIVLAGYNVPQQQLIEQLERSEGRDDQELATWLKVDSMALRSLSRLSRTVIRRQLSAASGCRTILPLIEVLPIPKQLKMYLRFEGPLSEVDLSVSGDPDKCASCTSQTFTIHVTLKRRIFQPVAYHTDDEV